MSIGFYYCKVQYDKIRINEMEMEELKKAEQQRGEYNNYRQDLISTYSAVNGEALKNLKVLKTYKDTWYDEIKAGTDFKTIINNQRNKLAKEILADIETEQELKDYFNKTNDEINQKKQARSLAYKDITSPIEFLQAQNLLYELQRIYIQTESYTDLSPVISKTITYESFVEALNDMEKKYKEINNTLISVIPDKK